MKRLIWAIMLSVPAVLSGPPARAISLEFVPGFQEAVVGQTIEVDIVVSGLGAGAPPSVGAYSLEVDFDPSLVSPLAVQFGGFLGIPEVETLSGSAFLPGAVALAEVSLLATSDIDAMQPASFILATLFFDTLAPGTSQLLFAQSTVDDPLGGKLDVSAGRGSVNLVPEPDTLLLLGLGLLVMTSRAKPARCARRPLSDRSGPGYAE